MEQPEKKLTKWLDKLQQESWQLELVVSGFAIFLMLGALSELKEKNILPFISDAGLKQMGAMLGFGYIVLTAACFFILINLVLHVLLRGVWISTIGLRYVSGDINFDSLRLAPRFDRFLRKRIGSFDSYILRLENICSVVFSFTFLIVFMLLGFLLFFALLLLLIYFIENGMTDLLSEAVRKPVALALVLSILLAALLYFIDFVTLGWLKRLRWLSVVYFPIYRFFSVVTLASLYRPIYYNLVDNKFGRRVGFLLVPYILGTIFLMSFKIKSHVFFPEESHSTLLRSSRYDDLRGEDRMIYGGSIPSKFVENGFLELFIRYSPIPDDGSLALLCPDFKPLRESGFGTDLVFNTGEVDSASLRLDAPDTALVCLAKLYEVQVDDSIFQNPTFHFFEHPNHEERGLLTILDVAYLPRGPHQVWVRRLEIESVGADAQDTLQRQEYFSIPFWKE